MGCSVERPTWQGTKGSLWPVASEELGLPTQQPVKNEIQTVAMGVSLEAGPPLVEPLKEMTVLVDCNLKRDLYSLCFLSHRESEREGVHYLKPRGFEVVCPAAIDHIHRLPPHLPQNSPSSKDSRRCRTPEPVGRGKLLPKEARHLPNCVTPPESVGGAGHTGGPPTSHSPWGFRSSGRIGSRRDNREMLTVGLLL